MQSEKTGCERVMSELMQAQARMEQRAFAAINEQDKLLSFIQETIEQIGELGNCYDMFTFEVTAALEHIKESGVCLEQAGAMERMLEYSEQLLAQLMQLLDAILVKAEDSSEVIHAMEEEIALSQDAVAALKEHLEEMGAGH